MLTERAVGVSGSGSSAPSWRFPTGVDLPVLLDLLPTLMGTEANYQSTICPLPVHRVFCLPTLYSEESGISNFEILKRLW